jgi:predicted double-glycine peptidase
MAIKLPDLYLQLGQLNHQKKERKEIYQGIVRYIKTLGIPIQG